MTYDEAMDAVGALEGIPVAIDVIINKPAPLPPGSGTAAERGPLIAASLWIHRRRPR
jgi:hypothetical protein